MNNFSEFAPTVFGNFKKLNIDDAEIQYIDQGEGTPIIFVHGALEDYRTWDSQIDLFSKKYRFIAYSRRFNYPNQNIIKVKDFSAQTESNDLAKLIDKLKLKSGHIVGHSFGGLISLFLAKNYPKLVRSLTLSEPSIISWLPDLTGGTQLYDDFYIKLLQPVKKAFKQNDNEAVLRSTLMYFYGADLSETLPEEVRAQLIANFREWYAIAYSTNAYPSIEKKEVQNLKMPVLLLSAGQTLPSLRLINAELKRLIPKAYSFHLDDGTHDYWLTHPRKMGNALMNFLKSVSKFE